MQNKQVNETLSYTQSSVEHSNPIYQTPTMGGNSILTAPKTGGTNHMATTSRTGNFDTQIDVRMA
jgi:hypothetical protein